MRTRASLRTYTMSPYTAFEHLLICSSYSATIVYLYKKTQPFLLNRFLRHYFRSALLCYCMHFRHLMRIPATPATVCTCQGQSMPPAVLLSFDCIMNKVMSLAHQFSRSLRCAYASFCCRTVQFHFVKCNTLATTQIMALLLIGLPP